METKKRKKIQKREQNLWKSAKLYRIATQMIFFAITGYFLFNFSPNKSMMMTLFALVLVTTLILRAGFCGWVCPVGTINDFIRFFGKSFAKIPFIKPINKKYNQWIKKNRTLLDQIDHYARYLRYILLLWILQAAIFSFASIKEPGEHGIFSIFYLVIGLLIFGLFNSRAWCKYGCPVGGLVGLVSKLSPTSVTRHVDNCINCKKCSRVCPMGIDVASKERVNTLDCNTCLMCVDACPIEDTLELRIILPFNNQPHKSQSVESAEGESY